MNTLLLKIRQLPEPLVLVFMLELLHFSMWVDFVSPLSRALLLIHLGFFLIWQPLWHKDEKLRLLDIFFLFLLTYTFIIAMNWLLLFAWVILLIGISGGRIIVNSQERIIYMLVLIFLVSELLIRCTTMLFNIGLSSTTINLFEILLPILPLIALVLPVSKDEKKLQSVDFIHAISISTLISLLVTGTLLTMYQTQTDYLVAMLQSLIAISIFLLVISWLLTPRTGFSGLPQLWLRSMLNIGTPFEAWLSELSILFRQKSLPDEFLKSTMDELVLLPWISGVEWTSQETSEITGVKTKIKTDIITDDLTVTIYSHTSVSGALYFHCKLLVQLINNFYVAKLQEREHTQQTHLQAIYETGARVTHDIKNLLQSLQAVTSVVVHNSDQDNFLVSQQLLKRQLPMLTQRLKLALDKLQAPNNKNQESIYLKDWWSDLKTRTNLENISWQEVLSGDTIIPVELFDSVVDNLLENIRGKIQIEKGISIRISLFSDTRNIVLTISDSGKAIPAEKVKQILKEPLQSNSGLGIGLYQAAKQAESQGYTLALKNNLDGNVCFELQKQNSSHQITLF